MKSAVVTGGAGFIGVHLVNRLYKGGFNVIVLDNLSTGTDSNRKQIESLGSAVQFILSDVSEKWEWQSQVSADWLSNLQYVYHFASPASPNHYQRLSLETMKVNSQGLMHAIEFADHYNAKVIFSSTSEVYGDPGVSPQPESYWGNVNSFGPRSCYDEAKRFGEALIYSSNKRNNTRHGIIRIFNTYGPHMSPNDGRVIINFLKQGLQKEVLTVYGDGSQTRSFCYIDDLIEGIMKYSEKDLTDPLNIGNQEEYQIQEIAEKMQKIFAKTKLDICYLPLPEEDPKQRRPDLTKTLQLLSPWKPVVDLEEGISRTLKWLET